MAGSFEAPGAQNGAKGAMEQGKKGQVSKICYRRMCHCSIQNPAYHSV